MKKYYLCPVVGDGSEDNPYRLKIADYYGNHVAVFDPAMGWGIGMVSDAEHLASIADPEVNPFPDVPIETLIDALPVEVKYRIAAFLSNYGLAVTEESTLRSVLVDFVSLVRPGFDLDKFRISD